MTNWPILDKRYSCMELATMLHALAHRQADVDGVEDPLVQLSFNRSTCSDDKQTFCDVWRLYRYGDICTCEILHGWCTMMKKMHVPIERARYRRKMASRAWCGSSSSLLIITHGSSRVMVHNAVDVRLRLQFQPA